jgi:hypothetical protein
MRGPQPPESCGGPRALTTLGKHHYQNAKFRWQLKIHTHDRPEL